MPHDTPSSRCTPSDWCERPRWRERKPWTARELRHKPGRRTIRIPQTHSRAAPASGGGVQSRQRNNSLSPGYTDLGGKLRGKKTTQLDKSSISASQAAWQGSDMWPLRRQGGKTTFEEETHLQGDGERLWRWWGTSFGRYKHRVQSKPQSTSNLDWQKVKGTGNAKDLISKEREREKWNVTMISVFSQWQFLSYSIRTFFKNWEWGALILRLFS